MKKIYSIVALLCASVTLFAQTELVDFSKITLDSWGGSGAPVMTLDQDHQTISIQIIGTPGYQWGNQAKITLGNVAETGLDTAKEYKLSFTAVSDNADCGGVTLKFFDNNELFYTKDNYLSFSNTPFDYASEWIKPAESATNGTIVFDFGWDPAQTITISSLSFLERTEATGVEAIHASQSMQKMIIDGQVYILRDGVRYNALGAQVK